MSPRDVEQLDATEYRAMIEYANKYLRAEARRMRKGRRG